MIILGGAGFIVYKKVFDKEKIKYEELVINDTIETVSLKCDATGLDIAQGGKYCITSDKIAAKLRSISDNPNSIDAEDPDDDE